MLDLERSTGPGLAAKKTDALILYDGHKLRSVQIHEEDLRIQIKPTLEYLGLTFGHNLKMM